MKSVILIIIPLFFALSSKGQSTDTLNKMVNIDPIPDVPQFPGGDEKLKQYLHKAIHYPASAKEHHITGRVFLEFTVEKDGSLDHFKIMRGLTADLDQEAIRVMRNSPKWIPVMQNGHPMRTEYMMPIKFELPKQ